ncbi:Os02g0286500 [Oryza sativa Japonica Group]|uniref:Os02g0286500 protein n=1 Tax=Oryza sativa subsp. japonica TaxID=39947 RepID=A0A0P0VHW3_ORYSJ|nr:hypothetical protein EE612_010503 [Oryza sativa]BAS78154.1 Os02g0286500 [Oryza sativa Japonica Group]
MAQSDLSFGMNGWMRAEQRRTGRGGDGEPGERGRGSGGLLRGRRQHHHRAHDGDGGRHGRRRGGGGGGGVGGDGGARAANPPRHRRLHSPGVGDAGGGACAVQEPRRRLRGPPLLDPQGEERVERWEDEIRELRAHDAANEQARSLRRHRSRLPTSHRSSPSTPHRSRPPTPPLRNRARPPPSPLRLLWPPFWCGDGSFPSGDGARLKRCPLGRPAPSPPAGLPSRQKITVE